MTRPCAAGYALFSCVGPLLKLTGIVDMSWWLAALAIWVPLLVCMVFAAGLGIWIIGGAILDEMEDS